MAAEREWAGTTYGGQRMHRWLITILKYIDNRLLYAFAFLFVVPVCLILNPSRGIIYRYFREHFNDHAFRAAWHTYVNHCMFAQAVIDKFSMYAGKKFKVDIVGYDNFLQLGSRPEGFVQLSSHVGNYEIAGYTLVTERKTLHALVFAGEKETVMDNRNKMFSHTNIKMIPLRQDMGHLFEINQALADGNIVSIPADRIWGSEKAIAADFLGKTAHFPQGPFSVACMRALDVLTVNVMKTGWNRYKIYVTPLPYDKQAPRKQQIEELSNCYVRELERIVKRYPTQWYNYFEFWT